MLKVRLIVTSFAVWGTGFNIKEVTFINIAWLPKATVQVSSVFMAHFTSNMA